MLVFLSNMYICRCCCWPCLCDRSQAWLSINTYNGGNYKSINIALKNKYPMESPETILETLEATDPVPAPAASRPVFLTVLCILTFVGSGIGLFVGSILLLFSTIMTSVLMNEHEQGGYNSFSHASHSTTSDLKDWITTPGVLVGFALLLLASASLTLFGGIRMYRLRQSGYYFYIFGQVINILLPFFLFGATLVGFLQCIFPFVFGIGFIVMYGVNYKYMKK